MPGLNDILTVILGGGRGTRLWPLTQQRSKPAVPIAGKYRLIDIPISNSINSSIFRIAVLTQFNSVSLNRHITQTYHFDAFHQGLVQVWAAEQTMETADWYQGSADAIRKQGLEITSMRCSDLLILSGDHLYRMDYGPMARFHWESGADITVGVQPVSKDDVGRFGVLKRNADGRITAFAEKPKEPAVQEAMINFDNPERPFLGSMGIYIFKTNLLFDILKDEELEDFGSDVLPKAIQSHKVFGYVFEGYWEDIGTIRSFYETNLMLARPNPPFNFFDPAHPIYTHPRFLPGSTVLRCNMENVLITDGCCIEDADIRNSVIGVRSQIARGARISDTVIMGSDYYDRTMPDGSPLEVPVGFGENCVIEGAIVDKNARIGKNVIIKKFPDGVNLDMDGWVVRDGIVVIPKNSTIRPGAYIGPE
ncbi:MAG TPA: glucose-1-phosphate adenylyltransferase [Levilinea sp.]|nr:glucose-1-phosphate adenylyltransferase [Levilinea sp.]